MTYASSFAYETNEIPRLVDVKGSIIRCGCSPLNYAAAGHFHQFVQKKFNSIKTNYKFEGEWTTTVFWPDAIRIPAGVGFRPDCGRLLKLDTDSNGN